MEKVIGSLLIAFGCVLAGMLKKLDLAKRKTLLSDIEDSLLLLENEISAMLSPLPRAMKRSGIGRAEKFFNTAADLIDEKGAAEGFITAVDEWGFCDEERQALCAFGAGLGAVDMEGQIKNISLCRKRISIALGRAQNDHDRLGKLYIGAGAMSGALIVILLI